MASAMKLILLLYGLYSLANGEKDVPESCEGLDKIGSSPKLDCDRADDCLSVDCNVTDSFMGYGAIMVLLPCNRLPALKLLLKSPTGTTSLGEFDSSHPVRTTVASLSETVDFEITVSWATPQIATIMSSVNIIYEGMDPIKQPLVQPTNVTIPECVPAATTCLALEQLAADAREGLSCSTDGGDDCDTVTCTAELIGSPIIAQFQVLPCNDTPAVNVVVKAGSSVLIDRVVSESQEIPFLVYKVYVTLDQRDNSIGLEVDFIDGEEVDNVLSYTVIPIDKTQCIGEDKEMSCSGAVIAKFELLPLITLSILLNLLLYM